MNRLVDGHVISDKAFTQNTIPGEKTSAIRVVKSTFQDIDDMHGVANIRPMWKHHYENSFNDVKHSHCDNVRYDCFINNKGMVVGAVELMDITRGQFQCICVGI